MSPFLLVVAICAAGTGSERPDFTLGHAVFLASESTLRIELSYEIPYTSLTFRRESTGYVARFSLRIQCWDPKRTLVGSQDWNDQVRESAYDATMQTGAKVSGLKTALVRRGKLAAEAAIQDLQSERSQVWEFSIDPPSLVSELRLSRARRTGNSATDTLYVGVETYQRSEIQNPKSKIQNGPAESIFVLVSKERRIWTSARRALAQDSWRSVQQFVFPLAGYENGRYEVKAQIVAPGGKPLDQRRAAFEIANSIFGSERDYREKVNQLLWIATESEMQRLRTAPPPQRESLWNAFWQEKDRTPTTEENETERTYFERIDYSEKHFGHGDRGYRSDRARVYIKYGPPDNIESLPFERESNAYEKWYYYGLNLTFVFYDVNGFGEFKQVEPKK